MNHVLRAHILKIGCPPGQLGGNVEARHGLAHHTPLGPLNQRRAGAGVDRQIQPGHEISIGKAPPVRRAHDAVFGGEALGGKPQPFAGAGQKQGANLGRRMADSRAALADGLTAGGEAFVRRRARVGGLKADPIGRHAQLFHRDLPERGAHALAELCLAGEDGGRATGSSRIQLSRRGVSSRLPGSAPPACAPSPPISASCARAEPGASAKKSVSAPPFSTRRRERSGLMAWSPQAWPRRREASSRAGPRGECARGCRSGRDGAEAPPGSPPRRARRCGVEALPRR